MPVLARTLEAAGLSTVLITNMPFWAEHIGVPRTLAVEFPYGHAVGQPGNVPQQTRVVREALGLLETARVPGTVVHSAEAWPEPTDIAVQAWQPSERSPIVQIMSAQVREVLRAQRSSTRRQK